MSIFTDVVHAGKPAARADGTAMTVPIHPSVAEMGATSICLQGVGLASDR